MNRKSKRAVKTGICKLTGKEGKYVKSHIIPQGFIPKIKKEEAFLQPVGGGRTKKSWTGWYDAQLVIREGEDLLSDLDSWATKSLRNNRIVWTNVLGQDQARGNSSIAGSDDLIRQIPDIDTARLRLFCLSILWRSAATILPDFNDIDVPPEDLERLGRIIKLEEQDDISFYPVLMTQLLSDDQTDTHLTSPVKDYISVQSNSGKLALIPFFRFYFSGLVIHTYLPTEHDFGKLNVGSDSDLYLMVRDYKDSREKTYSEKVLEEHMEEYVLRRDNPSR